MTWLKIDDGVRTHPKIVLAGPAAAWQWFCGNCYCRQHLTDGFIPDGMLSSLVPGVNEREARKLAAVLVRVNLWHLVDGGFAVHDFLDWNPTRAQVLAKRAEDLNRKKLGKPTDSVEIPTGKFKDSEASRAGGHVSPSVSSQPLGISSLEGGMGETVQKPIISGQSAPRGWGKVHSDHVPGFCDWVCLPEFIFEEFRTKSPGTEYVRGWAQRVRQQWEGQTIGKDNLKFWRTRWSDSHPEKATSTRSNPEHIERMLAIERGERKY